MNGVTKMAVRLLVWTELQRWLSSCCYGRSYKDGCPAAGMQGVKKDGCPAVGMNGVTKMAVRLLVWTELKKMAVRLLVWTELQRWLSGCWCERSYKDGCPAVGMNGVKKMAVWLAVGMMGVIKMAIRLLVWTELQKWLSSCWYERTKMKYNEHLFPYLLPLLD